jgi:hypothetical protein
MGAAITLEPGIVSLGRLAICHIILAFEVFLSVCALLECWWMCGLALCARLSLPDLCISMVAAARCALQVRVQRLVWA